ncbi:HAMP domain-containing protein [Streptomyces sp. NRRL B-1677]|uniref:sensor histidine kinase n=1 Tax=Streptomyces sp. NRRL B-1677 TaxID=2682966 RepID=UPI001892A4E5|nr:nitrate- and nitrite sensing domain-containing protein [Streptomyces sp. NRRL B-1677]MBF6045984.1 HAMP domain-containing protein [Streptomyces sp. NRRL B-1677]
MPERTARVRNRLTVSVAVITLAVLGASTFGVREAWRDLTEARRLAALASADASALALAHSLADERDAMVQYVAGGRADSTGAGLSDRQRVAVDRQIEEFRPGAPAPVRELLDALPHTRREAYSGKGDALAAYNAYTPAVRALRGLADTLDRRTRGDSAALPPLARATEAASASRGLLLGALAAQGRKPELAAAAQRADARTQDALADFTRLAPPAARDAYAEAVTGPEVAEAQSLLDKLTRTPSSGELATRPAEPVRTALTTRLQRMRGVEDTLAEAEAPRLEALRHEAMTELERRVMAAALCLFTVLFTGIWSARSVTRPLASVRLGTRRVSADPVTEEPVAFKGRDDEFAETARAVNHLQGKFRRQQGRIAALEGERTRLIAARQDAADERDSLRAEQQRLTERLAALPAEHPGGEAREVGILVGLSLRTLGLVERQLAVIEGMEAHEADPERLDTLFKLDHLATRMRRNSENLLVLAGAESGTGRAGPVPLLDVLRAASGEIERYQRVRIQSLPPHARLAGFASEDVSHLVAELLENATVFSPPDAQVQVSAWHLEGGEIVLCVQDEGIGMDPERLAEANALLADPAPAGPPPAVPDHTGRAGAAGRSGRTGQQPLGLGLHVVARLAARHGIRVQLREQATGGVAAVVVLPVGLLPAGPPAVTGLDGTPPVPGAAAAPRVHLPGSIAEANSHTLRGRPQHTHRAPGAHAARPAHAQVPPPVHPADPPPAPVPGPAETDATMQLTAFTEAAAPPAPPAPAAPLSTGRHARPPAPADGAAPGAGLPNGTALPKRTPKAVAQRPAPQRVRQGVDAEALRRKLAGFQRGAADGRRDARAELAGRDTQRNQAGPPADGGTPEEARG